MTTTGQNQDWLDKILADLVLSSGWGEFDEETAKAEILARQQTAIDKAVAEARKDELQGIKEHHTDIPLPWEVGTGPYIEGRLVKLNGELAALTTPKERKE